MQLLYNWVVVPLFALERSKAEDQEKNIRHLEDLLKVSGVHVLFFVGGGVGARVLGF